MNKFNEVYVKIIMEANNFEKETQINRKISKDTFKEFIGKKFISAHCNINRNKPLKENEFLIVRGIIEDIKIESIYNSWRVAPIWNEEAQKYGQFDTCNIECKRKMDCSPEKFEEMLKESFPGEVDYSASFPDLHSRVDYPETIDYLAPDNGQSDDEIKKMMIDVAIKHIKKENIELLKEREKIDQKILKLNKFLGE